MDALTAEEIRVLGSLIEKSFLTPDTYPLTQNALIAACNQLSNRNPVVAYDDNTVRLTLNGLRAKHLARVIHTHGGRAPKHRHVLDEALELQRRELALICVLCLRGAQTVGELRTRTERMWEFSSLSEVEDTLERLAERPDPLVARLDRAPGQKESRFVHLLGGDDALASAVADMEAAAAPVPWAGPSSGASPSVGDTPSAPSPAAATADPAPAADRDAFAALEARVSDLEERLADLRRELGLSR